jgi:hypothetical protein
MAFLDTIGQRAPQSRAQGTRSPVNQNVTRNDAPRVVQPQTASTWKPPQNDRIHPAAIWCAVLFVVGAVSAAAWLGMRNAASVASSDTESAAEAQPQTATAVDQLNPKTRLVQPQGAVRRGTGIETVADGDGPRAATASEAPVSEFAAGSQPANVSGTDGGPVATPDPIAAASIVAIPEDDNVYSSEGAGVVAPRLTSLGFVRRFVSGLRVRTSTIELVVSKSGAVERAKIFSTPAHWEDALLLSRAKTFQFVPAYRNGFPVRYRFVMDVDTSP